jgi:preprotein translocase subunit SecG
MTTTILIIVNVFAALSIIVLALMQQSKGDMGSAFGGGGSQSMFGSRGSANFLTRLTAVMCAAFFFSSLALAYVYAQRAESNSVVQSQSALEQSSEAPVVDNEIPTIEGEESQNDTNASEIPVIEAAQDAVEDTQQAVSEVIESTEEAVTEAIDAAETEIPAVPESN